MESTDRSKEDRVEMLGKRGIEKDSIKLSYCKETGSFYVDLSSSPSADSSEVLEGLVVDFGENGEIVGLDIQHAWAYLDLSRVDLERPSLPLLLEVDGVLQDKKDRSGSLRDDKQK